MSLSSGNPESQYAEISAQLIHKQQLYQRLIWIFYGLLAICVVGFVVGLIGHSVIAIATSFVCAMMLGMAYLGVVIARDDEIKTLKDRLAELTTL